MEPDSLQEIILGEIQSLFPNRAAAVDALATQLNVGKDAIYRRMRGDTLLTPGEIAQLARAYKISLDSIVFDKVQDISFTFSPFAREVKSFADFLEGIRRNFSRLAGMPGLRLQYATNEIPVFSYCYFYELILFKLYVWGRTTWHFDYLEKVPFDFHIAPPEVSALATDIIHYYNNTPSEELWTLNIADNTISQIEYHLQTGGFRNPADALVLCDRLLDWVEHLRSMAAHGQKFMPGKPNNRGTSFDLYHNELAHTNNTILVLTDSSKMLFTTFCNPNHLVSGDPRICDFTASWLKTLFLKANHISGGHSEKSRTLLFSGLRKKIESARGRIHAAIQN